MRWVIHFTLCMPGDLVFITRKQADTEIVVNARVEDEQISVNIYLHTFCLNFSVGTLSKGLVHQPLLVDSIRAITVRNSFEEKNEFRRCCSCGLPIARSNNVGQFQYPEWLHRGSEITYQGFLLRLTNLSTNWHWSRPSEMCGYTITLR